MVFAYNVTSYDDTEENLFILQIQDSFSLGCLGVYLGSVDLIKFVLIGS